MEAVAGMLVYLYDKIYEIENSAFCEMCAMWQNRRCAQPLCTRFTNFGKSFIFKKIGDFHPRYFDLISWTSETQKKEVYEIYERQIRSYRQTLLSNYKKLLRRPQTTRQSEELRLINKI